MPPVGFEPKISAGERPVAAGLLRSWVRIPPGAWIFVCCECRVLSGRGLCDELIARPEESYRLCCVVCDLETSRMGAPYTYDISHLRVKVLWGLIPKTSKKKISRYSHYLMPSIPDLFIKIQLCNNLTVVVAVVRDNSRRMCVKYN